MLSIQARGTEVTMDSGTLRGSAYLVRPSGKENPNCCDQVGQFISGTFLSNTPDGGLLGTLEREQGLVEEN